MSEEITVNEGAQAAATPEGQSNASTTVQQPETAKAVPTPTGAQNNETPAAPVAPVQPQDAQPKPPTSPQLVDEKGNPIADPIAYVKALQERMQRISERAERAEKDLKRLNDEDRTALTSDVEALRKEVEQAKQDAQAEMVKAWRLQARAEYGLDDDLMEFVTATTQDEIRTQAYKLAVRVTPKPQDQPTTPPAPQKPTTLTGNPAGQPGTGLELDDIVAMSPQQIMANWDVIDQVLKQQGK